MPNANEDNGGSLERLLSQDWPFLKNRIKRLWKRDGVLLRKKRGGGGRVGKKSFAFKQRRFNCGNFCNSGTQRGWSYNAWTINKPLICQIIIVLQIALAWDLISLQVMSADSGLLGSGNHVEAGVWTQAQWTYISKLSSDEIICPQSCLMKSERGFCFAIHVFSKTDVIPLYCTIVRTRRDGN